MPRKITEKRKADSLEALLVRLTPSEKTMLNAIQESMTIIKQNKGETVEALPSYSEVVGLLLTKHSETL